MPNRKEKISTCTETVNKTTGARVKECIKGEVKTNKKGERTTIIETEIKEINPEADETGLKNKLKRMMHHNKDKH